MYARRGGLAGFSVDSLNEQAAHRAPPVPLRYPDRALLPAVSFQQRQLGKASFVRHVGDPLSVGRPARIERVMRKEGHLIRLATGGGLHVEVAELIRRTAGG